MKVRCGVDIEQVANVQKLLESSPHARERLFTDRELQYCNQMADPLKHLTGRFSAKEALFKVIGSPWPGMSWKQAEVQVDKLGIPSFRFKKELATVLQNMGLLSLSLSISYTDGFALAFVTLLSAHQAEVEAHKCS